MILPKFQRPVCRGPAAAAPAAPGRSGSSGRSGRPLGAPSRVGAAPPQHQPGRRRQRIALAPAYAQALGEQGLRGAADRLPGRLSQKLHFTVKSSLREKLYFKRSAARHRLAERRTKDLHADRYSALSASFPDGWFRMQSAAAAAQDRLMRSCVRQRPASSWSVHRGARPLSCRMRTWLARLRRFFAACRDA